MNFDLNNKTNPIFDGSLASISHRLAALVCVLVVGSTTWGGNSKGTVVTTQNVCMKIESAVNQRDWSGLVSLYEREAKVVGSGISQTPAAVVEVAKGATRALPDLKIAMLPISASSDQVVALEIVAGTRSGTVPFLGFPANGTRVAFSALHVLTVRNGKIVSQFSQTDFIWTVHAMKNGFPMDSLETLVEKAWLANQESGISHKVEFIKDSPIEASWLKLRLMLEQKAPPKAALLDWTLDPAYRLTRLDNPNGVKKDLIQYLTDTQKLLPSSSLDGLKTIYRSQRFLVKYGTVEASYWNPEGQFGLPKSTAPRLIRYNEIQIIGVGAQNRVVRHYFASDLFQFISGANGVPAGELQGGPASQPSMAFEVGLRFLKAFAEKDWAVVATLLHPEFHHQSPWDDSYGGGAFLADYIQKFGKLNWSYQIRNALTDRNVSLIDYDSLVDGNVTARLVEVFTELKSQALAAYVIPVESK